MVLEFVSCFGSGHKMHLKKTIFDIFCQFFGPTFICIFLSHLLYVGSFLAAITRGHSLNTSLELLLLVLELDGTSTSTDEGTDLGRCCHRCLFAGAFLVPGSN